MIQRVTHKSQAARQGLVTAEVVLKHETSNTYQSHIYESIDCLHVVVKYIGPVPFTIIYISWHAYSLYPWTDFNAQ